MWFVCFSAVFASAGVGVVGLVTLLIFWCLSCRQLKKLSEDSLTKQPEEVFDILEKLGEG